MGYTEPEILQSPDTLRCLSIADGGYLWSQSPVLCFLALMGDERDDAVPGVGVILHTSLHEDAAARIEKINQLTEKAVSSNAQDRIVPMLQ